MPMNRLPMPSTFVQRAAAAQTPAATAAPAAAALHREEAAHAHGHEGHASTSHAHPTHATTGHGPTPRPRRSTKSSKPKRRKKTSSAAPSDDDEPEMHDVHEHGSGVAAVAFDGESRDGGDDDAEGGEERSRQDRLARTRALAGEAAGTAGAASLGRLPRLHGGTQPRLAVERFAQRACDVVAQGAPDMARQLERLHLELLRATPGVRRLDRGGIARVKQLLATCMPRSRARAARAPDPQAAARIANGHLMLVMQLLQLQRPLTPAQRDEAIAHRVVQLHEG